MDLASLIQSFATGTYVVTRSADATPAFSRGIAQPTVDTDFSIVASVQPATGKDLLRLPEGRRTNETRVLFTTTELFTGDQGLPNEADTVTIDGDEWEVQHCERWVQAGAQGIGYRIIVQAATPENFA